MATSNDPNIIQHNPDDFQPFVPAQADSELVESIVTHVTATLGPPAHIYRERISNQVHVDVLIIAPTPERAYHILVTAGMSERPMAMPAGHDDLAHAELCMILPPDWRITPESLKDERHAWPLNWLRMLARFPHVANSFLAAGHTFPYGDPPEPFHPTTPFSCWLFLNPVPLPRAFGVMKGSRHATQFLLVVPITEGEMRIKLNNGAEVLIPHFAALQPADFVNSARPIAGDVEPMIAPSMSVHFMVSRLHIVYQAYMRTPRWKQDMMPFAPPRLTSRFVLGLLLLFILVTIPIGVALIYSSGSSRRQFFRTTRLELESARAFVVYPVMLSTPPNVPGAVARGLFLGSMDPAAPQGDDTWLRPLWDAIEAADPNSPDPSVREVAAILADQRYVPGRRRLAPLSLTGGVRVHFFDTPVCASRLGANPWELPMAVAMISPGADTGTIMLVPLDLLQQALDAAEKSMKTNLARMQDPMSSSMQVS